jgi:hypothetical protein
LPKLIESIIRDYRPVEVPLNNAGFAVGDFAEDIRHDELSPAVETNFFGRRYDDQNPYCRDEATAFGTYHAGFVDFTAERNQGGRCSWIRHG